MSEQNDRPDGLFPEEEQPVKRENPYLRKNKATVEKGKPEKPRRERTALKADAPSETPSETPSKTPTDAPSESKPRHTFSDFMFEHVKLITAIATILVVVALVIATDVVSWVQDIIYEQGQEDKPALTLTYVEGLTHKSGPITWEDLEGFASYAESDTASTLTRFYRVAGTSYEVWISGPGTQYPPTYVYLYDMKSGAELDLDKGELDDLRIPESPTD